MYLMNIVFFLCFECVVSWAKSAVFFKFNPYEESNRILCFPLLWSWSSKETATYQILSNYSIAHFVTCVWHTCWSKMFSTDSFLLKSHLQLIWHCVIVVEITLATNVEVGVVEIMASWWLVIQVSCKATKCSLGIGIASFPYKIFVCTVIRHRLITGFNFVKHLRTDGSVKRQIFFKIKFQEWVKFSKGQIWEKYGEGWDDL